MNHQITFDDILKAKYEPKNTPINDTVVDKYFWEKQYKKLKYAKEHRHGKRIYLRIIAKTNQHYNYKKPIYSTKYIQKSKWVYKYKLASESWWGEWGSEWEDYYPKTPSGYTWCGSVYKNGDGWSKTYYKYKKKVTYTDSEEVIVGYTTKRLPVYACISSRFTHASFDPLNVIELRFIVNPFSVHDLQLSKQSLTVNIK